MPLLVIEHLKKTYSGCSFQSNVEALRDISFSVEEGEFIAIMGESGSGKTTLLNILATLDFPTAGSVRLNELELFSVPQEERASFRRTHLGFVFQDFNLLNTLSVEDNISLPLVLGNVPSEEIDEKLKPVSYKLGIEDCMQKYPYEISGGQSQRTAIARAIVTNPKLLLADEPTGALDSRSSASLLQIFDSIHREGQTILMVTHSARAASKSGRVLFIKDGVIYHQMNRGDHTDNEFYQKIGHALTTLEAGGAGCA